MTSCSWLRSLIKMPSHSRMHTCLTLLCSDQPPEEGHIGYMVMFPRSTFVIWCIRPNTLSVVISFWRFAAEGSMLFSQIHFMNRTSSIIFEAERDHVRFAERFQIELAIDMILIATALRKAWKLDDRRALALNTAKCLVSAGWTQGGVEALISLVAKEAGDNDIEGYRAAIQSAYEATYKAGRSGLVNCMGEESVAVIETSLRNIEDWRFTDFLDTPKVDFVPSKALSGCRQIPPLAS